MKKIIKATLLLVFIRCGSNSIEQKTIKENNDSLKVYLTDTIKEKITNSITTPQLKVFLPRRALNKREIIKNIIKIDKLIKENNGEWKQNEFSTDIEGCLVEKYFFSGQILYIRLGCGDCSPFMAKEEYYFNNNEIISLKTYSVNYNYDPCWSDKECQENGITEEYKRKNVKKRDETYYILDSLHISFKRNGNLNDTLYVRNDTLKPEDIQKGAIEYLNTKNTNQYSRH